jgi:hypothetical protein
LPWGNLRTIRHRARLIGAKLIIAKLDRLSRDVHFVTGLEKAGLEFVCADMPEMFICDSLRSSTIIGQKMVQQSTPEELDDSSTTAPKAVAVKEAPATELLYGIRCASTAALGLSNPQPITLS